MKLPQISLVTGLCVLAVVLFFVGRWTKSRPVEDTRIIDSLTVDNVKKAIALKITTDSMRFYKAYGQKYYKLSLEQPKEKIIHRTIFKNDQTYIRSASELELDSIIVSRYRN